MSGSSQQSTSTTSLPSWLTGAGQQLLGAAGQQAQRPYQQWMGPQVAPFTQGQNAAMQGIYGSMFGSPVSQAANQSIMNTLQGSSNPFQSNVIDSTNRQVTDAFNRATGDTTAMFNLGGALGGSAHQQMQGQNAQALAQGLAENTGRLNQSNFENQQNRMMSAIPMAFNSVGNQLDWLQRGLGVGNLEQQYGQNLINAEQGNFNNANNYGWNQLNNFANILGSITGAAPRTQTTTAPGPDRVQQGLGGAAILASLGK